jgi:DNA-directed RNA polymerase subunit beta
MEVWALEAYGAAYTLQEILTLKSDDIIGRSETYKSILHNTDTPEAGVPESFAVLQKELQALSLSLDVKLKEKPEEKEVAND